MRRPMLRVIAAAGLLSACSAAPVSRAPAVAEAGVLSTLPLTETPLTWSQVRAMPAPAAGLRIAYGPAALQFGELRLPEGAGPFPIVILIHGGCWQSAFDLTYFAHWAEWFRTRGYASWTIEYRRVGDDGGGWPGTLLDVAAAIDHVRALAGPYPLSLEAPIAVGHSAGGQLALWAASRATLPSESPLWRPAPLPIGQVIGLAPITDLSSYRVGPAGSCHAAVDALLGGAPTEYPDRYRQTSPIERLPLASRIGMVVGETDTIVDPAGVARFAVAARAAGDAVTVFTLPGAGHFDTGVPTAASAQSVGALLGAASR